MDLDQSVMSENSESILQLKTDTSCAATTSSISTFWHQQTAIGTDNEVDGHDAYVISRHFWVKKMSSPYMNGLLYSLVQEQHPSTFSEQIFSFTVLKLIGFAGQGVFDLRRDHP